ncbi:MAG TPA: ABC-2 transporter permease [Bacillales bacterium]
MVHLIRKDFRLLSSPQVLLVAAGLGFTMSLIPQPVIYTGPLIALFLVISIDWAEIGESKAMFLNSLPIGRKSFVQTKYLEGIVIAAIGNAAAPFLKFFADRVIDSTGFSFVNIDFGIGTGTTLFILACYYPCRMAFGPTVSIMIFIAAMMLLNPLMYFVNMIPSYTWLAVAILFFVLAYACSYYPALRIYRKKDF